MVEQMKMEVWEKDFKNKGWEKAEITIYEIISNITKVDTKITLEIAGKVNTQHSFNNQETKGICNSPDYNYTTHNSQPQGKVRM